MGKKKLHHICLEVWKNIPKKDRDVSFYRFKKLFKINCLSKYEKMQQFHEKCSYLRSSYIRETLQVVFSLRYWNIQLKPAFTTSKRTEKKKSLKANCRYTGRNSAGRNTVGTNKNVLLKANSSYNQCRNIQFLPYLPSFLKQS